MELGHNVLIVSDQFNFIDCHKTIDCQQDVELAIPLADKLHLLFGENAIESISFDKGFWRQEKSCFYKCTFPM